MVLSCSNVCQKVSVVDLAILYVMSGPDVDLVSCYSFDSPPPGGHIAGYIATCPRQEWVSCSLLVNQAASWGPRIERFAHAPWAIA